LSHAVKGAPFAATAARQAAEPARPPPSGEQANTRLTGSVGAPCARAGSAAHSVNRADAATAAEVTLRDTVIRVIGDVSSAGA
jgi:hypothetical protein